MFYEHIFEKLNILELDLKDVYTGKMSDMESATRQKWVTSTVHVK